MTALSLALRNMVFGVWAFIHPQLPVSGDAAEIASAIVTVVLEDGDRSPVTGSHALDAAAMAYWAACESTLRLGAFHAHAVSPGDHRSAGAWQLGPEWGQRSALEQARAWLYLLRAGAKVCPESPASPLSGGCQRARKLADRRMEEARRALATHLVSGM
jgi:hypothetical protein